MEEIIALLVERGYKQSTFDHRNDVWTKRNESFIHKAYVPLLGNSMMFYDCHPNGSPISYIEFHNCYNKSQIERLRQIL